MSRRRLACRSVSLVVVAAAGLSLAACSSSSHPVAAPVTSNTPAATTSSTPAAPTSSTLSPSSQTTPSTTPSSPRLAAINVQPGELPKTWQPIPYKPDAASAANQAAIVTCVGGTNTAAHRTGEAHSPEYKLGNATVSSDAESFASQADVAADIALLHSPKIDACYETLLRAEIQTTLPAGATIKTVSIKIVPGPGTAPQNVVATGTGVINLTVGSNTTAPTTAAVTTSIYITVSFISGPLTEAEVDTQSVGRPLPPTIAAGLTTAVASRAAKA